MRRHSESNQLIADRYVRYGPEERRKSRFDKDAKSYIHEQETTG